MSSVSTIPVTSNNQLREPVKKKKKNVENSTLGLTHPPPTAENVENFQKKKI